MVGNGLVALGMGPGSRLAYACRVHPEETAADRLLLAFGLHDFGVAMYRQRMRREHPDWSPGTVETEVDRWLADTPAHPGAPSARRLDRLTSLAPAPEHSTSGQP